MQKISVLLACLLSTLTIYGQDQLKVVATASIFADMATVIAGDFVDVESIVAVGADPHLHEPTPSDARLVTQADLILMNGLTFEGWLNELIENAGTSADVVRITENITPVTSDQYQNASDPHAWMNAQNGIIYIENIKNALVRLDPAHQKEYEFNYNVYRQQLLDLDKYIKDAIASIPEQQRVLITSHDAFTYYGEHYGLRLESAVGTSTEAEVQTSDIVRLTKIIRSSNVPAIFVESTINPKLLKQIANDNQLIIGGELFADSLSDEDGPASTYYKMLKHNTDAIVNGLKQPKISRLASEDTNNTQMWIYVGGVLVLLGGLGLGAFALTKKK